MLCLADHSIFQMTGHNWKNMSSIQTFLKDIWDYLGNIDALLSIFVMLCGGLMGVISLLKRRKLNGYLGRWLAKDTLKSLKYYIDTNGQQVDPCNYDEICVANKCKITKKLVPFFIKEVFPNDVKNQYFILLGDSGTGKTTFMVQLFKTYSKKLIKKYNIEFIPLLHKGCMREICAINEPENTILLLDGMDENSNALDDYEEFKNELLEKTESFYKVIITCRTQFFPNEKEEPYETGRISFNVKNKKNLFYKIYVSPFDDKDIKHFLKRKYPFVINSQKRKKAMAIVKKTPYLMVRPMLLSYIDDLINSDTEYKYIHQIYMQLTENWMQRENIPYENLNRFTHVTAVQMYRKNSNYIEAQDIAKICRQYNIHLREIEAKSRSLLNRNGLGDYKFAHKSIYEYILAKEAMDNLDFREEHDFTKLDMANLFFQEMSSIFIAEELSQSPIDGNFTKMKLEDIDFRAKQYLPAVFKKATVIRCFFDGCILEMANIDGCLFEDCHFNNCHFNNSKSITKKIRYVGVKFINCKLKNAECPKIMFEQCSFINCDLRNMNLTNAQMIQCEFNKSNLAFSKLNGAKMKNCTLINTTLGPLEYENLQADLKILNDIRMANKVAEIFINNGYEEAKENGVRIVTR